MGGIGAGREPSGRGKLDDMPRVDIRRLHRGGHLEPGFRGVVPLQAEGREVGGVALRRDGDALVLAYTVTVGRGVGQRVEDRIPLQRTPQPGGGTRLWFSCPVCRRRCAIVYGSPRFRCRACTGAPYASQNETARDRLLRRARAIHVRLGGSGTMIEGIPPKPKRMRWATYRRLVDEAQSAMHEAFRMTMADARRLHRAIVGLPPAEDRLPHL